jgi:hypothetical protein
MSNKPPVPETAGEIEATFKLNVNVAAEFIVAKPFGSTFTWKLYVPTGPCALKRRKKLFCVLDIIIT